jgi:hypothetical protein
MSDPVPGPAPAGRRRREGRRLGPEPGRADSGSDPAAAASRVRRTVTASGRRPPVCGLRVGRSLIARRCAEAELGRGVQSESQLTRTVTRRVVPPLPLPAAPARLSNSSGALAGGRWRLGMTRMATRNARHAVGHRARKASRADRARPGPAGPSSASESGRACARRRGPWHAGGSSGRIGAAIALCIALSATRRPDLELWSAPGSGSPGLRVSAGCRSESALRSTASPIGTASDLGTAPPFVPPPVVQSSGGAPSDRGAKPCWLVRLAAPGQCTARLVPCQVHLVPWLAHSASALASPAGPCWL